MAADGCEYTSTERKISEQACNVLNELRKKGQLTDVVLKVEDGQFEVHRAIMSASSPYFRALFTNGMDETDHREVFIPGISADMMGIIVEYAYTRDSNVTAENVERLLPAADQFHVLGLVKACSAYLQQQIDFDNVIGIRNFAKHYFCSSLERTCHKFLMENFVQVANHGTEILILPLQEFMDLLDSDELNVKNEEFTFDVIMRWISYDVNTRKEHIVKLLKCVRLGLLSKEFFVETVKKHPLIKENAACKPVVIETLKYLCDLNMGNMDNDPSHPLARPRVPHELMFVIGGWSGGSPTNVIETYDTRADKWIVVDFEEGEENVGPRAYHGCATVGQLIYVIGGFDGMSYFNSCRCFDPSIKKWNEIAPMNACRCYVSVAVHEGLIYAMGGFDGHVRQNTAERYTPRTNQWSLVAPMNHQRSDASATTCDSKIYICGGFNGQECLNNAEYYDPATNQWTLLPPMRNRRSGVGVISHDSRVYAIGGFNGITRMNNGERYDPTTNAWTVIAEMYSPRSNFGIEVIDDLIFTIGGFNGVTTIYNVECYDPIQDEWYDCMDMNLYRSALSACIVKGLPNVKDYIHKDREGKPDKNKGGRGGTPHGQHTQHHGQQQYGQQNQQHAQQQQQNQQNNPLQPAPPPPPPPPPPPAHGQNQNNQQQNNHVRGFQIRGLQEQDQIQPQVVQQHQLQQQLHQQLHAQHQQLQQQQQVQAQQQQLHQQVQQQLLEQQQARDHGN